MILDYGMRIVLQIFGIAFVLVAAAICYMMVAMGKVDKGKQNGRDADSSTEKDG